MFHFIASYFQAGGFFMWPIAVLMFIGLALSIERFIKLKFVFSIDQKSFMTKIENFLNKEDIKGAVDFCIQFKQAVLPKVIKAGLSRAYRDEKQVEQGIEVSMLRFYPLVRRNIRYVAIIANVATLIGLLGTIFGLIEAFTAVAQADPTQKQTLLANGISIAMNTTALGLITAIPCLLAHGYLSNLSERIFDQIDESSAMLIDMLNSRMYQSINETTFENLKNDNVPSPSNEVIQKVS